MLTSDDIYSINVLVFEAVCKLMLIYMRQCLIKPLSSRIMSFVTRRREERTDGGEKESRVFQRRASPFLLLLRHCAIARVVDCCRRRHCHAVTAILLFQFNRDWTIWESWVWTKPTVPRAFILFFKNFFSSFEWNGHLQFPGPAAHKLHSTGLQLFALMFFMNVCGPTL